MTIPTTLRAFRPTTLQIFCVIGFFYGIAMFVHSIRQRRRRVQRFDTPTTEELSLGREFIVEQTERAPVRSLKVIQLSQDSRAVEVSHMTQQQKIAAALLKAGSSNSPSWYQSELYDSESNSPVQVITASPTSSNEGANRAYVHGDPAIQPGWKTNLMLGISAALTVLSLYFFLNSLR